MSIDCIPAALPLGSIKSSSRYPQPDRETSSINAFYNHKMSYWAELESYQPLPLCTCGAHDTLATQMEQDKVIRLDWSRNTSWSKSRSLQMRTWEGETTSFQFYSMRKQDSLRWITPCITTLKPPPFWLEAIDPLPIIQLRVEEEGMGA